MKGFITQAEQQMSYNMQLEKKKMSVMERFPEYSFMPTTLCDKRSPWRLISLIFFISMILTLSVLAHATLFYLYKNLYGDVPDEELQVFSWPLIIGIIDVFILIVIINWYKKGPRLSQVADYVQQREILTIVVKNDKMGVLTMNTYQIFVPIIYDKLSWEQKGKLLRAELNGESFLIDIHNNRLK